jgi:hypothetical protein
MIADIHVSPVLSKCGAGTTLMKTPKIDPVGEDRIDNQSISGREWFPNSRVKAYLRD